MPVQEFLLGPANDQRIQVHWTADSVAATILLNRSIIGSLTTAQERVDGKDFTLPDGSPLHVRFVNDQPAVSRMGVPLAPMAVNVAAAPQRTRKRGGCLTTWLIFNLVLISILTLLYLLASFGSTATASSSSFSLTFFGLALLGCVGIVGFSALLAWKKWGFYLIVAYVLINFFLAIPFGLLEDFRTYTPLVAVAILYYWIRRNNIWEMLS